MRATVKYLGWLAGSLAAVAVCLSAQAQTVVRYGTGRPDLAFVSNTVRLARDGESIRRLERPGPVVIEAEVQNRGPGVARDIVVRVDDNGQRAHDWKIPILVSGATVMLRADWDAARGPHRLTITLDAEKRINETNEDNNVAVINAPVPRLSWPMLVGIVVLAVAAGALAGYAAWRIWGQPRPPTTDIEEAAPG